LLNLIEFVYFAICDSPWFLFGCIYLAQNLNKSRLLVNVYHLTECQRSWLIREERDNFFVSTSNSVNAKWRILDMHSLHCSLMDHIGFPFWVHFDTRSCHDVSRVCFTRWLLVFGLKPNRTIQHLILKLWEFQETWDIVLK
jgi:hypothetical protein